MNAPLPLSLLALFLVAGSVTCPADELSVEALQGTWLYTHIVMDGTRNMPVNYTTEFRPDGTVIYYDNTGTEMDRGRFRISGDAIIYSDNNGEQTWKLVSLEGGRLHVDHRGAEMFFEKQ
jgi:hypothetical protein